ncbi:MAG: citrate/2-methylcitrate synthase [Clostridiales bacterium]|nr:citrate/2-methylcitrate synthase [Clostridiales bacterium]
MRNSTLEEYVLEQEKLCQKNNYISDRLFNEYGVNRGLRDENGKGVLTGLTSISKISAYDNKRGERVPAPGRLSYRGHNVGDLIDAALKDGFGFEKTAYLLIFGEMPDETEEKRFREVLGENRSLPTDFVSDVIMHAPTGDIMNSITKCILSLASYDDKITPADTSNSLRQCIELTAVFPMLAVYSYHAYNHQKKRGSMYVHRPLPELSAAANILRMLRPDTEFTELEEQVLDAALILHMEHGGGNNSTFTTRVVTSSGSDTYSAIAAAMSSLKGPKHGGANIKVMDMMRNIRDNVSDITDRAEVEVYLKRILDKQAFDGAGLIYGMGHAIYTVSDPREVILKQYVEKLAAAKGRDEDMELYRTVEETAPQLIYEKRGNGKPVCPNVDFYSGFVYDMLGIPTELYTPLFAVARIAGWSAHRIEELTGNSKIIRPAYMSVI